MNIFANTHPSIFLEDMVNIILKFLLVSFLNGMKLFKKVYTNILFTLHKHFSR